MKAILLLFSICILNATGTTAQTFVASTPAHEVVRDFLQISATDSIDFIRWKLDLNQNTYTLSAEYGLCQPGTPGFSNGRKVALEGQFTQSGNYYELKHHNKSISILQLNPGILHLLDGKKNLLVGNGGWSYSLNNTKAAVSDAVNIHSEKAAGSGPLVFEGRTPCQELSAMLGMNKSDACNKKKWYFILYTEPATGKPSHFLMGGSAYRKETMEKGRWETITQANGNIIYRLHSDAWTQPLNLLKGDNNTLFFLDGNNRLMVGNGDFSYTLNRKEKEYARIH